MNFIFSVFAIVLFLLPGVSLAKGPLSAWSSTIGASVQQSQDEFSHMYQRGDLGLSYLLSKDRRLDLDYTYRYRLSEFEEESDPAFMGDDLETTMVNNVFRDRRRGLFANYTLGIAWPTSRTSQVSGQRGAGILGFSWTKNITRKWKFLQRNLLYINNHEYETANEAGTIYNSQYDLINAASLRFYPLRRLSVGIGGSIATIQKFSNRTVTLYSITSSASYAINKTWRLHASYRTRNEKVSNNSLFDDDNTFWSLGTSLNF